MNCPGCQQPLVESPQLAGQQVACPHCGHAFVWPAFQPAADPPATKQPLGESYVNRRKKSQAATTVIILAVVGVFLVICFLVAISFQATPGKRDLAPEASLEARSYVRQYLQGGRSATLEVLKNAEVGKMCYSVSGRATVGKKKTVWACVVSYWQSAQEWRCVSVHLNGKSRYHQPKNRARYARGK